MKRWLPHPVLAATLGLMWLLLNMSVAPGTIILGAILGVGTSHLLTPLIASPDSAPSPRPRKPRVILKLCWTVLVEIVRSNYAVAKIVFGARAANRRSGFVRIPMNMRNPYGLTALAIIITATPGTVWVEYQSRDNSILLHVLDLIDEDEWIHIIRQRYEAPLMEIFP